jgi:hypothetical protein
VDVEVESVDEVRYYIKTEKGVKQELRDYFSFMIPGAEYMPLFKRRIWDGKIRLFDILSSTLPRGLKSYLSKFCKDRQYTLNIKESKNPLCITEEKLLDFYDTLKVSVKKQRVKMHPHQSQAILHAINSHRCNNISDRFWKKFNNLRLAPLSAIRNKIRQKDFSFGSNRRVGYTDGNRLL